MMRVNDFTTTIRKAAAAMKKLNPNTSNTT